MGPPFSALHIELEGGPQSLVGASIVRSGKSVCTIFHFYPELLWTAGTLRQESNILERVLMTTELTRANADLVEHSLEGSGSKDGWVTNRDKKTGHKQQERIQPASMCRAPP